MINEIANLVLRANKTYQSDDWPLLKHFSRYCSNPFEGAMTLESTTWDIDNYYIESGKILRIEITTPLIKFMYADLSDVKKAWLEMLKKFVEEQPNFELTWEMKPRDDEAVVTIRIAKSGDLKEFTQQEARNAISAVDAMFDE